MAKKLTLLTMAIGAMLALAIPAMASASSLTMPEKTLVPVGTAIQGTSTDVVTTTSLGNLKCEKVTVNGKVTKNNGTEVEGTANGASTSSNCFFKTNPIAIKNITLNNIKSTTIGSGTASLSFEAEVKPGELNCKYSGSAVPFTYTSGTDSLLLSGGLTASPAACGTASIKGNFTLETIEEKGPVLLS